MTVEQLADQLIELAQDELDVNSLVNYADAEDEDEQSRIFNSAILQVLRCATEKMERFIEK